jgi:hypothetical protein
VDDLEAGHRELLVPVGTSGYVLLYSYTKDSGVTVLAVRLQLEAGY